MTAIFSFERHYCKKNCMIIAIMQKIISAITNNIDAIYTKDASIASIINGNDMRFL